MGDAGQGNSEELKREQLDLDKRKMALEESFAKKWIVPLLTLAGVIIAGVFSTAGVWMTSISKDTELRLSEKQKEAEAALADQERQRRWRLDFADFIMKQWPTLKGDPTDQQFVYVVISTLFPKELSGDVFDKLKTLPGQSQAAVEHAERFLKPPYDLSGEWRCIIKCMDIEAYKNRPVSITQAGNRLTFRNEGGTMSGGNYTSYSPPSVIAMDWGLMGFVQDDGKRINWANGSVWAR